MLIRNPIKMDDEINCIKRFFHLSQNISYNNKCDTKIKTWHYLKPKVSYN